MNNLWVDATQYRRDDTDRIPTAWRTQNTKLVIYITCNHIDFKGEWVMHCYNLGLKCYQLNCKTMKEAKVKSLQIVKNELNTLCLEVATFLQRTRT